MAIEKLVLSGEGLLHVSDVMLASADIIGDVAKLADLVAQQAVESSARLKVAHI